MTSAGRRSGMSISILLLAASAAAQSITPAPTAAAVPPEVTAVSECHAHGSYQYCKAGNEWYEALVPTRTEEWESQYTGCHAHGGETFCRNADGNEVEIIPTDEHAEDHADGGEDHEHEEEHDHDHDHEHTETEHDHDHAEEEHADHDHSHEGETDVESAGVTCHFHAGVEHCTNAEGETVNATCERTDRDYNIPLRVGLLFVILVTGALGVFMPILATSFTRMSQKSIVFVILKQFGTGVVLSTAFIHLFTHAQLMFTNECLGELEYESVTAAVFLAGLFLSFLVDYLGARFVQWRQQKHGASPDEEARSTPDSVEKTNSAGPKDDHGHGHHHHDHDQNGDHAHVHPNDHSSHVHLHGGAEEKVSVWVLEAGVIFHSLLIGLTLVVAGDSFFLTLFAVIIFHQMFEGIALGTCIAGLPSKLVSFKEKALMATAFSLITPIGMAIGIGVLGQFNGNDPSTLIAIGTLDAVSAGILAWVGIVEMLAKDWLHGPLCNARLPRVLTAMTGLLAGMILMSVLGKWT